MIIKNEIRNNFTIVPNALIIDTNLSMGAKMVYCYLSSKPDRWKILNCDIMKHLNVSEGILAKYFKELLETGWIDRKRGTDEAHKLTGEFVYTLLNPIENPYTENSRIHKNYVYGKNLDYNNTKTTSNTEIINNTKKEISKEKKEFEDFWAIYPKQRAGSKAKALVAYLKVLKEKRATEEHLLAKVKEYANSREVREGYAKGCAAWLNDDRFNSDYNGGNNGIGKDYNRENTGEYSGLGRKIG